MEQLNKHEKLMLILIIFFAGIISVSLIGQHRFHGDEALYASWATSMAKSTSIYVGTPYSLYKPPFFLFASALIFAIIPIKEIFAIIPNILSFLLSIYVVFLILLNFYKDKYVALTGALIFSLSPVNLLFSATAFMDPLLVLFLLFSTYYLINKKYFISGLFFGLAFGTKSFAVFYLPFYLFVILNEIIKKRKTDVKKVILESMGGFFSTYSVAILWGILNSIKYKKHFLFAQMNWLGILDRPESYVFNLSNFVSRMSEWLYYYKLIYFFKPLCIFFLIVILLNVIFYRKEQDFILSGTIIILLLLTSMSQMPIYDRYILTFIPFVIMLSASSVCSIFRINTDKKFAVVFIVILTLFLAFPVRKGIYKHNIKNLQGENFGAMYNRNDGVDLLTNFILGKYETPVGICMHRDFSWVFDYYLYRAPAGYSWFHYQPNDADREAVIKEFARDLRNTKMKVFLLFYADNDEIDKFEPFISKYDLCAKTEYEIYDRFNKKNIILYRILLK